MGLLANQITLIDAISAPINSIINTVNSTVNVFRQAQGALNDAFDPAEILNAQNAISAANDALERFRQTGQSVQFNWQTSSGIDVFRTTGAERYRQELDSVNGMIDALVQNQMRISAAASGTNVIPPAAQADISALSERLQYLQQQLRQLENTPVELRSDDINNRIERLRMQLNSAVQSQNELNSAVDSLDLSEANRAYLELCDTVSSTERYIRDSLSTPIVIPVEWQAPGEIEVFQTSGIERYRQELTSANSLIGQLAASQERITQNAVYGSILPPNAANDMISLNQRISQIQQRIAQISARPVDVVSSAESRELEQLRMQLNSAVQLQNRLNAAVDNMDVEVANNAYLQLSQTIGNTERYIRDNISGQSDFNAEVRRGQSEGEKLFGIIKRAAGAYLGIRGLQKAMDLSDTLTSTTARLDMMNDGMQSTAELQNMIFASAERARGSYVGTADAVAKLGNNAGDAFNNTGEIVAFMEQVNKQFVIAGTEASGVQAAMLQLTQAMGSGVLRGEEFNSILEQAPNIIQTIADYMGVPKGALKDMAAEGQITAEIVKNAMFSAANETNAKFESMPKTFSQIWTSFQNNALMAFQPVLEKMNELANNQRVQEGISAVLDMLAVLADVALDVLGMIADAAGWVADNWIVMGPIIGAVAVVMGIYGSALLAVKVKTLAANAAQMLFNSSLLACPIFWVIAGLIAFIGIIAVATNAVNDAYGLTLSFGGMLGGSIMTILAALGNLIYDIANIFIYAFNAIWNVVADFANFFANVWTNPLGAAWSLWESWFTNLMDTTISVAGMIDKLLGTDYSGQISQFKDKMLSAVEAQYGEQMSQMNIVMEKRAIDEGTFQRIDYDDAFAAGYYIGDNLANKFSGADYTNAINNALDFNYPFASIEDIAGNTDDIAEAVGITGEELKYLRDLAEQEVVNRFTTAEISVSLGGITNNVSSDMDLDGIVDYIETGMYEAAERVAEGVH